MKFIKLGILRILGICLFVQSAMANDLPQSEFEFVCVENGQAIYTNSPKQGQLCESTRPNAQSNSQPKTSKKRVSEFSGSLKTENEPNSPNFSTTILNRRLPMRFGAVNRQQVIQQTINQENMALEIAREQLVSARKRGDKNAVQRLSVLVLDKEQAVMNLRRALKRNSAK